MKSAKNPKRVEENFIFQRRNPIRNHFVNTPKVLLYGYKQLSDNAKITYQVIDGYDWEDKETGDSKGYAFPATDTLAQIRGVSKRTIERHLAELEQVGLITRQQRRNLPSILYIEDVSEEEIGAYLRQVQRRKGEPTQETAYQTSHKPKQQKSGPKSRRTTEMTNDRNDVSNEPQETTKMTFAYNDEIRQREEQQQAVVAFLGEWKVGQQKAEQLVTDHSTEYIEQKIALLRWKLENTSEDKPIKDSTAWLIQAIEQDYQPPEEFTLRQPTKSKVLEFDEEQGIYVIKESVEAI